MTAAFNYNYRLYFLHVLCKARPKAGLYFFKTIIAALGSGTAIAF